MIKVDMAGAIGKMSLLITFVVIGLLIAGDHKADASLLLLKKLKLKAALLHHLSKSVSVDTHYYESHPVEVVEPPPPPAPAAEYGVVSTPVHVVHHPPPTVATSVVHVHKHFKSIPIISKSIVTHHVVHHEAPPPPVPQPIPAITYQAPPPSTYGAPTSTYGAPPPTPAKTYSV